jgi:serine/threonine protein kinase
VEERSPVSAIDEAPIFHGEFSTTSAFSYLTPTPVNYYSFRTMESLPLRFTEIHNKANRGSIGEYYDVIEVIGEGAFGIVSRAKERRLGIPCAIKTIWRSLMTDNSPNEFLKEYELLRSLEHPNILHTFDLIYDDKKINLVTEIFSGGDLFDKI